MKNEYTTEEDLLDETIILGRAAEKFIQSDLGAYLINKSNQEIEYALEQLISVDSEDPKAVRQLQNMILVAKSIQVWLTQAVEEGISAEAAQESIH